MVLADTGTVPGNCHQKGTNVIKGWYEKTLKKKVHYIFKKVSFVANLGSQTIAAGGD